MVGCKYGSKFYKQPICQVKCSYYFTDLRFIGKHKNINQFVYKNIECARQKLDSLHKEESILLKLENYK